MSTLSLGYLADTDKLTEVSGSVGSMGGLHVAAGRRVVSQQQQQHAQSLRARQ